MSEFIAALPMYDWPEVRAEIDAEWARLRDSLRQAGVDAPEQLVRRNADMPPVPGGIRDASGEVIAPDPATLPPDELDYPTLWRHRVLLFAQTCWGPMELGLARHVQLLGQPDYSAFEGGQGVFYSSAIVMRRTLPSPLWGGSDNEAERGAGASLASPPPRLKTFAAQSTLADFPGRATGLARPSDPHKGEGVGAPADGARFIPIHLLRSQRFIYNSVDSMSGILALTRDLDALGESLDLFASRSESGGHRASIRAVAQGDADVAAIDCRSWAMAQRFEPAAKALAVVGWTARRKGLPYIAAAAIPAEVVAVSREVLAALE
ncbi:phosphate ABC transporter substrate-binding protein [Mesorhizobium sp. Root554]|uniref:PhnD/SsuA/transferrin family substrate-binding protein n=1 Tax=unclassified Mesorhizobium TaxID=325217 RepID=UPI000701F0EA|nr:MULTISPECIES: PhnD/SsuA/transferrin family substrate-binding protein [unclassified Mesorhizobium]KQZ13851.1 phosphate ABC transporter substrate-binding protein [Mesorhizobium sp. Root1471]KQZ36363.1 phosphate ABC transporter substrate-binding protein [Mesorhizobium sp. Root554]